MKRKTQEQRVLDYIRDFGGITSFEAYRDIGCTRLSAAIFSLRKKGYCFSSKMEPSINKYGDKVYYKRYFLADERN